MASGPPVKYFEKISGEDIKDKRKLYKNANTKTNDKKAVKILSGSLNSTVRTQIYLTTWSHNWMNG